MEGRGNSREIETELHELTGFTNPPFLTSKHAACKSKTTSRGASADFQAENSGIFTLCAFPWNFDDHLLLHHFPKPDESSGSEELRQPLERPLSADPPCSRFSFYLGLIWIFLGGRERREKELLRSRETNERSCLNWHWFLKNVVCDCCLSRALLINLSAPWECFVGFVVPSSEPASFYLLWEM